MTIYLSALSKTTIKRKEVIKMDNEIVLNKNNQAVTTSIKVAKYFGKDHRHVLRDIENILNKGGVQNWADPQSRMFAKGTYKHPQNHQEYPMYYMNKDGFTLLAMGFTGRKAVEFKMQYIKAFNNMEKAIREHNMDSYMIADPVQRAKKWLEEYKYRAKLAEENKQLKPKALFADAVSSSKGTILVGELAKLLRQNGVKMGAMRLFTWLRNNGYLIKRKGSDYNTPTQRSMEMGLFEVKETAITHSNGRTTINRTPRVTGKGQSYFINKLTNQLVKED